MDQSLPRLKSQEDADTVNCKACGCTWFEQFPIAQYDKYHNVILAQRVPGKDGVEFYLLRCAKCGEIHEPNVQIGPRDNLRNKYDAFLDNIEDVGEVKDVGSTEGEKV